MEPAVVSEVSFDPLLQAAVQYLEVLLLALGGILATWLTRKLNQWFGVQVEANHRDALERAINSGLQLGAKKVREKVFDPTRTKPLASIELKSEALATTLNYAIASTPDAIKKFGISPERLAEIIEARMDDGFFEKAAAEAQQIDQASGRQDLRATDGGPVQ